MEASKTKVRTGTILFIIAPTIYFLFEAITAIAWVNPAYSYFTNFISDLGVPVLTEFNGRIVNSPLHPFMNLGFTMYAILFVAAHSLVIQILPAKKKKIAMALSIIYGFSIILVAIFPGYDWMGATLHTWGAFSAFLLGNITLMIYGSHFKQAVNAKWFPIVSTILGVTGLAGFMGMMIIRDYPGFFERMGVYPFMIWSIITGILLLINTSDKREPYA
jgi:hypothetical membrane protein